MSGAAGALPAPLSPPECNLIGLDYMPLHIQVWQGSTVNIAATDAEFRARFNLMCAAWHLTPGGSLPNNNLALCTHAGLGRDLATFDGVKAVALHGFVLCSDGRLYHPFLCEQAQVALRTRLAARERQRKFRGSKKRDIEVTRDEPITSHANNAPVTGEGKRSKGNKDPKGSLVPSLREGPPTKGTPGHHVPPSRLPATANTQQPKTQQPPPWGSVPRSVPTDGMWRRSKEGIQAKAAELGMQPYCAKAAQMRQAPCWEAYRRDVLKAHADAFQLMLMRRA